jgi:hypothetical protein
MRRTIPNPRRSEPFLQKKRGKAVTVSQYRLFENLLAPVDHDQLPEGLLYAPEFLLTDEEQLLAERLAELPFAPFEFHGFVGNRRVLSFGWRYAFDGSGLGRTDPIPA